ncbi:MAG: DsrE family protein [Gammaproteobacteria bacterium]
MTDEVRRRRRSFLGWMAGTAGLFTLSRTARAQQPPASEPPLFGEPEHKVVYQLNKADPDYIEHVLFSVGEMVRKYGDKIQIVVTAFAPGIQLLGKQPERPIPKLLRERASSLALYGVQFHACHNTMKTLGWTQSDLVDYAEIVPIGADDIMRLQEKGYAYLSW